MPSTLPALSDLNYLDLAVALITAFFLIRGLWVGFMRQLAAFFALLGSYIIAAQYADQLMPWAQRYIEEPKLAFLAAFVLLYLVAAFAFTLIGKLLKLLMHMTLLGWLDRLAGMVLGALKATILCSLLYMLLASTLSPTNELLRGAYSTPYLQQGSELLQSLINDPKLREYFQQKQLAIPELPDTKKTTPSTEGRDGSQGDQATPAAQNAETTMPSTTNAPATPASR